MILDYTRFCFIILYHVTLPYIVIHSMCCAISILYAEAENQDAWCRLCPWNRGSGASLWHAGLVHLLDSDLEQSSGLRGQYMWAWTVATATGKSITLPKRESHTIMRDRGTLRGLCFQRAYGWTFEEWRPCVTSWGTAAIEFSSEMNSLRPPLRLLAEMFIKRQRDVMMLTRWPTATKIQSTLCAEAGSVMPLFRFFARQTVPKLPCPSFTCSAKKWWCGALHTTRFFRATPDSA